ncbi:siderophore-interacting protein [Neisseria sp.]|uniref:siderophore-interacting protein n=1 Tax=Neisseria sp. TaxID=192066 RepID=UPI0026DA7B47|nr:siderophore-interacting protein [Neisseria sp.]MDO4226579.1 SIP domain-containing protein [Neisseria sp.]
MPNRTPIADTDYKNDVIDHINKDHADDVLNVALSYAAPDARSAQVTDIFEEGILLCVDEHTNPKDYFIEFELKNADIDEQLHYTVFRAAAEQGKPLSGSLKQYFTVLENDKITPNMQRLILKSEHPLPEREPGYAWYFQLQTHTRKEYETFTPEQQLAQKQLIEQAKYSSPEERGQVFASFFKSLRYYTLRSVRKSHAEAAFYDVAVVDIFLHGDTAGSLWAENLRAGDIVCSTNDFHEHTAHIQTGQAVLIGDETALPTVFAVLEQWDSPVLPIVVSITANTADQAYWQDCQLPDPLKNIPIHKISQSPDIAHDIIAFLETVPQIDSVWGAFEAHDATQVRKYLAQRGVARSQNRVKGYWRREH